MKKSFFLLVILMLNSIFSYTQGTSIDEQAGNFLRESGKLYVVISILVTIFAGIIIFLILQEGKIFKLEKKIKDNEKP